MPPPPSVAGCASLYCFQTRCGGILVFSLVVSEHFAYVNTVTSITWLILPLFLPSNIPDIFFLVFPWFPEQQVWKHRTQASTLIPPASQLWKGLSLTCEVCDRLRCFSRSSEMPVSTRNLMFHDKTCSFQRLSHRFWVFGETKRAPPESLETVILNQLSSQDLK